MVSLLGFGLVIPQAVMTFPLLSVSFCQLPNLPTAVAEAFGALMIPAATIPTDAITVMMPVPIFILRSSSLEVASAGEATRGVLTGSVAGQPERSPSTWDEAPVRGRGRCAPGGVPSTSVPSRRTGLCLRAFRMRGECPCRGGSLVSGRSALGSTQCNPGAAWHDIVDDQNIRGGKVARSLASAPRPRPDRPGVRASTGRGGARPRREHVGRAPQPPVPARPPGVALPPPDD